MHSDLPEVRLDLLSTVFLDLERERPPAARPPGRPRTRSSPASPLAEEPTP